MYISRLSLCGYKNTYEKSEITLNRGLNVLLGENGCGKTAVINALRMLFREVDSQYFFLQMIFIVLQYLSLETIERLCNTLNCGVDKILDFILMGRSSVWMQ